MKNFIEFIMHPFYKKRRKHLALLSRVSRLEILVGYLIESPKWTESEEAGFNGQKNRKLIFKDLLNAFKFDAIIETGTWVGNTTGFMAKTSNLPVYTCELKKQFNSLAKLRLKDIPNITFALSDSRVFLRSLAAVNTLKIRMPFIYLDAHWYEEELPLQEELEIIYNGWKDFVIMIDDFYVHGDDGYGYDSYGKKTLSLEVFSEVMLKYELIPFFPALSSIEETGFKRGCVVLARKGKFSEILGSLKSLCKKSYA